jgi:Outer membrane protein beta-barrel domain
MYRAPLVFLLCIPVCYAQAAVGLYAGAIGGISTLSADAGSLSGNHGLSLSSYSPSNGSALNVFAGFHFHDYLSVQANYVWNANDLILNSAASSSNVFYEESRSSSQHAAIADFLVYFRRRNNRIRPYLGTGGGLIYLSSRGRRVIDSGGGATLPPLVFSSRRPVFRSHVGIDLRLTPKLDFRYSFSEMIGNNDISRHLSPPAPRRLANFQNLFGFVVRF